MNNDLYQTLPLILIVVLFIGALLLNILNSKKYFKMHKYVFICIASLFVIISIYMGYVVFHHNTTFVYLFSNFTKNDALKEINLYVDYFNMFLIIIMAIVYISFVIFNLVNLNEKKSKYYSIITIFIGALTVFLTSGDLFITYIAAEIMVLSQAFLLRYDQVSNMKDNLNYIVFQCICSLFIFSGTIILYVFFGTFNIGELIKVIKDDTSFLVISSLVFLLSGYGAKLLFMPFHNILSKIQYNSEFNSSSVTVIGTFIAGIYALVRISFTLFNGNKFHLEWLFIIWGFLIIIISVMKALVENSLKKIITYIALSEGGYFIIGIGISLFSYDTPMQLGAYGAIYHMLNMAFFIPLLYFCEEIIEKTMGTDDVDKMGNIRYKSLLLVICFLIGIFSTMGIPMLNGFVSKWMLYKGLLNIGFIPIIIISVLGFLLIFISLIKVLYAILNVKNKQDVKKVKLHNSVSISMMFLSLMCIITGLFPQFIINNFLNSIVASIYDRNAYMNHGESEGKFATALNIENEITPLKWLFILVLIGIILYLAFIIIKYLTGRSLKNKFHEEAVYDLNEEVDGYTSSELIWSLNNNFGKYFKIFKRFKTESLNNYVFILLSIFVSLTIYIALFIRLGG